MKKVLVTGHLGYIGTHLVKVLKEEGHYVKGCDLNLFEGCAFDDYVEPDKSIVCDVAHLDEKELEGIDCVMHLAAISNDPMGDLVPEITDTINRKATLDLAKKAKKAGVPLFLFASSCSIYGKAGDSDINEKGVVSPLTPYASSKTEAEKGLENYSSQKFKTVCLRSATAYGYSPMFRADLVVNNLLACALTRGDIRVMSDGSPWRPLVHCYDIAKAFVAFLHQTPQENHLRINIGRNKENYQVKDIVDKVECRLPGTKVVFTGEVGADPRNYRVNFDLFEKRFPHFSFAYDVEKGMEELLKQFRDKGFSLKDFEGNRFFRVRTLKTQVKEKLSHAFS